MKTYNEIRNIIYSSPKQVKSTHSLLECKAHLPGDELLIIAKDHWVADLFPLTVPFHLAIQSRRFTSLSMGIVRPHCVHLATFVTL
jgi:hypothetical protein